MQPPKKHHLHPARRRAAKWAAASSAAGAALLASAPYVLSHPLGLKAALVLVNAASPAAIRVQAVAASWGGPLHITGLQVLERCPGAEAATPAAAPRGRLLLSIGHLCTEQSPFRLLLAASRHCSGGAEQPPGEAIQVAASHLAVDCSLREDGLLRLGHLLRKARLIVAASPAAPAASRGSSGGAGTGANGTSERSSGSRAADWPPASCLYPQCPLGFAGTLVLAGGALRVQLSEGTLHVPREVG